MVEVSRHATKRIRERLGLPKKAAQAEAERAILQGLTVAETRGSLRRFLDKMHLERRDGSDYRLTPSGIFVIKNEVLVTVLPVPENMRGRVMDHWRSKHAEKAH